jgi:hypothetical protein
VLAAKAVLVLVPLQIALRTLDSILSMALSRGGTSVFAYSGPNEVLRGPGLEVVAGWSTDGKGPTHDVNGVEIEWDPPASIRFAPVAVLVTAPSPVLRELEGELATLPGISLTTAGGRYLEIRPPGSNKATGLTAAIDRLGISREQVLAIGDSDNDVEMLEWAGISVVVNGATDQARTCSDYVTRFGASKGVLEVLRAVKFARRYFQAAGGTGRLSGQRGVDI